MNNYRKTADTFAPGAPMKRYAGLLNCLIFTAGSADAAVFASGSCTTPLAVSLVLLCLPLGMLGLFFINRPAADGRRTGSAHISLPIIFLIVWVFALNAASQYLKDSTVPWQTVPGLVFAVMVVYWKAVDLSRKKAKF